MKFILLFVFIFIFLNIKGQQNYELTCLSSEVLPFNKIETRFKDSIAGIEYVKHLKQKAIKKGYLLFSIDSIQCSPNKMKISLYVGPIFKQAILRLDEKHQRFLHLKGKYKEQIRLQIPLTPIAIEEILHSIETQYLNNGFPFVQLKLDELNWKEGDLFAHIQIKEMNQTYWGEINLKGNEILNEKIIQSVIHIQPGDLYNEHTVQKISDQLKQLPFIEEIRPFELLFHDGKVDLFLYLKAKPVSLITGVLGLQPNIKNTGASYLLTGDIRMKLVNTLKKAESIDIQWRNLQASTQSLRTSFTLPTLFKSAFGIDGQFQLYKKDSTFLELKSTIGLQYLLTNGNTLKLFYRNYLSSLLTGGQSNPTLLQLGNLNTQFYGVSISKQTLNYLPNPTNGYTFQFEGAVGNRTSLDSLSHLSSKTTTSKIDANFQYYFSIIKRHVLKFSGATDLYLAPTFVKNELLRFGGMATQRGFKEEELRANSRVFASLEYRFLLDKNSFLFLFFDQSWYENKLAIIKTDNPYGFGGGLTFGTGIGMFSISYALGKQFNNPVLISNGNVHFGYISYF